LRLLVATTNTGKIREIRQVLADVPVQLVTLADVPPVTEPEETGRTFRRECRTEGALLRRSVGLPTVAEDSGLVIDAIDGRPGVESARYPGATYADKFANLYRELAPHRRPWPARFVCSLCFVATGQWPAASPMGSGQQPVVPRVLFTVEATVEGEIAQGRAARTGSGTTRSSISRRTGDARRGG
jgi:XTP/dITP diphosphohydrolase